ncbi:MAG: hypothetical protein HY716_12295 [Planctomycetes bacterium]|nr:hypothetical protein [Planctomycetota bacterium]
MKYAAWIVGLALLRVPARADEVVLRNGARFEGRVTESASSVVVELDYGTITLRRSDVARIHRGPSALDELERRAAALRPGDVEGRYRLARWAAERDLLTRARKLFEEVVVREPDHAGARAALGYRRHEGRWMTEVEIRAAEGFVRFRGRWVLESEADAILKREAERGAEEARRAELELLRTRMLEAEAAANRARAAVEELRARFDRRRWDWIWGQVIYLPPFQCFPRILPRPLKFQNTVPQERRPACETRQRDAGTEGFSR